MTDGRPPSRSLQAHQELQDRLAGLNLPFLHTDAEAVHRRVAWENGGPVAQRLLQSLVDSPLFSRQMQRAAAEWNSEQAPAAAEIVPGWHLAPLPITERRERHGYACAMLLTPAAIAGETFAALCQSAGADAAVAADLLAPAAGQTPSGVETVSTLLAGSLDDLAELTAAENALNGFSAQLAESYEEINLLYSIGRSMKEIVSVEAFVANLCQEMRETLPYRWIAAYFSPTDLVPGRLRGGVFIDGQSVRRGEKARRFFSEITSSVADRDRAETFVFTTEENGPEILCRAILRDDHVIGLLAAGEKQGPDASVSSVDMKLLDGAARLSEIAIANNALYEEQQAFFLGTLEALTSAIDAKDPYTCGHSQRVSELSKRLAETVGLSPAEVETIRISGLVHDLGKIGVPESVLLKTSRLTDEEFDLIKRHPEIGHRILRGINLFEDALPGVLHHHERWDGRGYPFGLAGDETPLIARIIGVADAFDAMSSSRTYRSAMPRQRVLDEIRKCAGSQFDPELADAFLTLDLGFYARMMDRVVRPSGSEAA